MIDDQDLYFCFDAVWNAGCVVAADDAAAAFAVASVDDIEFATSQFLSLTSLAPLGNIFETNKLGFAETKHFPPEKRGR